VIISDGVTGIDGSVFNLCENLTSIVLPDSLTFISKDAFGECDKLTTVNYKGTQEQWEQINIEDYDNSSLKNAIINYEYTED
ncbi:MAG: leucine-rich repeat protein, partial [Spirochaetota bacterium]|nr:leucine-rich repeat protein [Spirochaetota bacterium]